jgi:pyruvate kinase
MRPRHSPIYAVCETQAVADSLTINWGVTSIVIPFDHADPEKTISLALETLTTKGVLQKGNTAVVISSISAGQQIVDAVQMRIVT